MFPVRIYYESAAYGSAISHRRSSVRARAPGLARPPRPVAPPFIEPVSLSVHRAPLSRLRSVHGAELRMGPITSRDSNSRGAVYDERPNACCGARVPLPGSYFISQPDGRAAAAEIMIVPRTGAPKRPWARLLRSSRRALVVVTPARWLGRPQRRGKD
jgi:hypothetical protein